MRNAEQTAMRTCKVKKSQLITTLRENREKHQREFQDAWKGYQDALITAFQKRLEQAKALKPGGSVSHSITLDTPTDHTAEYDRALKMLEWEQDEILVLSMNDFNCYVMDDWDWQRSFKAIASNYSGGR